MITTNLCPSAKSVDEPKPPLCSLCLCGSHTFWTTFVVKKTQICEFFVIS